MQEREREQSAADIEDPKVRALLDLVRGSVAAAERPLIDALARHWCERGGEEWLASGRIPDLAAILLSAFRFLAERSTEESRVAVLDPEQARDGWEMSATVVQTLVRDRPFIVDTVRETLRSAGCTVLRFVHPVFAVERDPRGAVLSIAPPGRIGRQESLIYAEIERIPQPQQLADALSSNLQDLIRATNDYQSMRARAAELAELLRSRSLAPPWNEEAAEIAALLDWLRDKNFVFLGYREYQFSGQGLERTAMVRPGSGLGILAGEDRSSYATPRVLGNDLRRRLNEPPLLIVSKTNAQSTVHRAAPMDYIAVKEIDPIGVVVGEKRFLGLFTAKAYQHEPTDVPVLRGKLTQIYEMEGAIEESHDHKAIAATFNSIPKVELLATPARELHTEIRTILSAEDIGGREGSEVVLVQRADVFGRGVFVVVIVPRERFSEELYRQTEARLATILAATAVLEQRLVRSDDSTQVRMHFYFAVPVDSVGTVPTSELRVRIASLLRTWDDRLRDELLAHYPRERARDLAERYAHCLPGSYKSATDIPVAVRDIAALETLAADRVSQVDLVNDEADRRFTTIKLYLLEEELVLSDFLPLLENFGLRVFAEHAVAVSLPGVGTARIHAFQVQDVAGLRIDVAEAEPLLAPAVLALHGGRAENDRLNTLVLRAGLDWRAVDLVRAYANHGLQSGAGTSRAAIIDALASHPDCARLLWQYFEHKFDPVRPAPAADRLQRGLPEIETQFAASLDSVTSLAADRILRALFSTAVATVRTNFYSVPAAPFRSVAEAERSAIVLKLECARIPHLPKPLPLFEIYVHAASVEGVHLRGAKVSRGGIRQSDRPDDFRTEVLALMQTQMIKNAVIVPAGAKGGFVVKSRAASARSTAEARHAYRTFISGLLDVTDNIVQGRVTAPVGMLAYDPSDPYLVVAADKGTATLSDLANEVAQQRQYWLGDAFASGGAHGYDHKKEGITARGAWECVKQHFHELGLDAEREELTVIGIGDMSGDVFGNGLLLSRRFLLRAAFNHQHVFLDPHPDPARAHAERERLFYEPRSSWADYSPAAMGPGGGVYGRNAKRVPLSEEARAMLGFGAADPSGEEVVRAILKMEADLLWNGGVGTYVKAADELHVDVGDASNDGVRVDGRDLRVKVVAEGGNLGFTQRGRVEYALRGGRLNSDAIDNSGGVAMSDHEVNLKIALAGPLEAGQLRLAERDQILRDLAGAVTQRVLGCNIRQARLLSFDQQRSQERLAEYRELMTQLELEAGLDRRLHHLPDRDALRARRSQYLGLTRPELAVLLAYAKLSLQRQVLASPLIDDPHLEPVLRGYFPDAFDLRFGHGVRSHRLRREIIAVELANQVIDTMGMTFVSRIQHDCGIDALRVVRAWRGLMEISDWLDVHEEVLGADPALPMPAVAQCWSMLVGAAERAVRWVAETQAADVEAQDLVAVFAVPVTAVLEFHADVLTPALRASQQSALEALGRLGTPRAIAERVLRQQALAAALDIAIIAAELGVAPRLAGEVYYGASDLVDLNWARQALSELQAEDRWEQRAIETLHQGLNRARRQLTREVLQTGASLKQCLEEYARSHGAEIGRTVALLHDMKSARKPTLAAFVILIRELNRLAGEG